jgi:heptaprenyl diphosphate synthase/octaprenyl-diphosphate synthase
MHHLPPLAGIERDLRAVEHLLSERLADRAALVRAAGSQVLAPGQPRLRAALVILSAQLGRAYTTDRALHAAAAVELIHAAAEMHDGLIDSGRQRAGTPAGPRDADIGLMVGDYLFALAAAEMALAPDARVIAYYSRSVMAICEGQLAPPASLTPLDAAREQYLTAIGGTTAALFEAGCKAGAVCGGLAPEQVEALGRFGYALGLAHRIAEDIEASAARLRAGVVTLPLIYAANDGAGPDIAALLAVPRPDDALVAHAAAALERSGGIPRAREEAHTFARRAAAALAPFPPSPARAALERIAGWVAEA